jgi:hypothetical protein
MECTQPAGLHGHLVILGGNTAAPSAAAVGEEERGVSLARAFSLLRESADSADCQDYLRMIAALLIEQHRTWLPSCSKRRTGRFHRRFLHKFVSFPAAFVIQIWVTPRIHRYLGIGFAPSSCRPVSL